MERLLWHHVAVHIAIYGNSGSGKSTLTRAIARERGCPTLDLDVVAWEPKTFGVPRREVDAQAEVQRFCSNHDDWVIEGCYENLIAASLRYTPLLVFLDPGMEQCLANCRGRPWEAHKFRSRAEQDEKLAFLLTWVCDYYSREGPLSLRAHEAMFESYSGPKRRITEQVVRAADVVAAAIR